MLAQILVRAAGVARRRPAALRRPAAAVATLLACGLLQACANPPPAPYADRDPSDPDARAPASAYRPATEPYVSRRPAEPKSWREQNDAVAPRKP
jgi:hypothetical protein